MHKIQKKALESWHLGRFVKTLAYFGVIPILSDNIWFQTIMGNPALNNLDSKAYADPIILDKYAVTSPGIKPLSSNLSLFNFRDPSKNSQDAWGAIDDVVMGGVSQSNITVSSSGAIFSGVVSTANSGGFASVRTRNFEPPLNLAQYTGIELRLKGDGQRYKFLVRGETRWDGVAFSISFDTERERWITVRIPFTQMQPIFRSKTVAGAILNPAQIYAFQLMLSKFEYDGALNPRFTAGNFQLQIESISAYSN
ncbi:CIA30 family protein [Synechococcus sp. PCC 7502]|uniref:CIA30 family protein n=1 Tax=Synechococcus sp. PCC 7502 TaxID=1173263 RepID=UPI000301C04A|nr:CIA30 family protein [Synechococcus sp. PCC 7502]